MKLRRVIHKYCSIHKMYNGGMPGQMLNYKSCCDTHLPLALQVLIHVSLHQLRSKSPKTKHDEDFVEWAYCLELVFLQLHTANPDVDLQPLKKMAPASG